MSDRRFKEVVTNGQSTGYGDKKGYRSLCSDCGTYHTCRIEEFSSEKTYTVQGEKHSYTFTPPSIGGTEMRYVADMRAWNCCNEGEEPFDGFPEMPDDLDRFTKR